MSRILLAIIFIYFSTETFANDISELKADDIIKQAASDGPRSVLWKIFADSVKWNQLCHGISSGEEKWLEVLTLLKPESDAAASEDFSDAFSEAIVHNPENVFRYTKYNKSKVYQNAICSASPRSENVKEAKEYIRLAKISVRKVQSPDLQQEKQKCLSSLEESEKDIETWE